MWLKEGLVFLFLSSVILNGNAQRGRTCRTPNGETATCKSIHDCGMLLSVVKNRDATQIRFIRESQCGYDQNPLVCCGTENNYISRSTVRTRRTISLSDIPRNDAITSRESCGFQDVNAIFNGNRADFDEFPWIALLQYQNSSGYKTFGCGGSIISQRYVLTAAHCVSKGYIKNMKLVAVRLGEWNTDEDPDCIYYQGLPWICSNASINSGIEEVIAHSKFNTKNLQNDIALIRLTSKINFSNFIRPICLPLQNEYSRVGEKLRVAGWGRTLNTVDAMSSITKIKGLVRISSEEECYSKFGKSRLSSEDTQICAGGEEGKASCAGDSGGPLMTTSKNDSSQWYVEGIESYRNTVCGSTGWTAVYTRVSAYLQWIYDNIRE